MNTSVRSKDKTFSLAPLFISFFFSDNPIVAAAGIPSIALFLVFAIAIGLERGFPALRQSTVFFLVLAYLATNTFVSFYHHTHIPFLFACFTTVYYLTTTSLTRAEVVASTELCSKVLTWTCIAAAVSLALTIAYPLPLFKIGPLEFHYFSLMYPNTPFMRPTGFMHEPGQLSFYVCIIVAARELLKLDRQRSLILLSLGLVTQSLAHILFSGAFVLYLILTSEGSSKRHSTIFAVAGLLMPFLLSGLLNWAIQRAATFYESPEEWGRFLSFNNVITLLDNSATSYLFGPNASLASRTLDTEDVFSSDYEGVSIYGENPLSPLIFGGIFASWPYYFLMFAPLFMLRKYPCIAPILLMCAFLTLQRPYTLEFPYSIALGLVIYCARIRYIQFASRRVDYA